MGAITFIVILLAVYVLGETHLLSDVYRAVRDRVRARRRPRPKTAVPLARVLANAHWRRIEIPTINRQSEIRTALGWEPRR